MKAVAMFRQHHFGQTADAIDTAVEKSRSTESPGAEPEFSSAPGPWGWNRLWTWSAGDRWDGPALLNRPFACRQVDGRALFAPHARFKNDDHARHSSRWNVVSKNQLQSKLDLA